MIMLKVSAVLIFFGSAAASSFEDEEYAYLDGEFRRTCAFLYKPPASNNNCCLSLPKKNLASTNETSN